MFESLPLYLLLTLLLEVPLVALLYPGLRRRMALTCALATAATFLLMTLALPLVLGGYSAVVITGEVLALLLEAAAYALASRGRLPPGPGWIGRALIASSLANALSFSTGLLIQAG